MKGDEPWALDAGQCRIDAVRWMMDEPWAMDSGLWVTDDG